MRAVTSSAPNRAQNSLADASPHRFDQALDAAAHPQAGAPLGGRVYQPGASAASLFAHVESRPYVRRDGECLEIRFNADVTIDYAASNDQSLGGNRVFTSDGGVLALSFETYFLDDDERGAIQSAQAKCGAITTRPREVSSGDK